MQENAAVFRFGVILEDVEGLRAGRTADPVELVALRSTLVQPLRGPAAKRLRDRVHVIHPRAEPIPYVWHLVSHGLHDGLRRLGTRTLAGNPARFGELQDTPENHRAWSAVRACLDGLQARSVIVRTGPSVAPGAVGRNRLAAFVAARRAESLSVIWEPEGLWTADEAGRLAQELDVTLLLAAFEGPRLVAAPPGTWLRVDGFLGRRAEAAGLDALADRLLDRPDTPVVLLGGSRPYALLRRLASAVGLERNGPK